MASSEHVAGNAGAQRVHRALAGEVVRPVVRGLSFIAPDVLPVRSDSAAEMLTAACSELRLDFAFVPASEPWFAEAAAMLSDAGVAVMAVVDGVLSRTVDSLGFAEVATRSARSPESLEPVLRSASEVAEMRLDEALSIAPAAVVIADDMAGAEGPLFAPAFLALNVLPLYKKLPARAGCAGVPAVLHSDGDIRLLLEPIARTGVAAIHGDCGDPANVSGTFTTARRHRLAFVGGIPTRALGSLASATLAGAMAGTLAEAGGVLVCDDGGVGTSEEAAALFRALAAAAGE